MKTLYSNKNKRKIASLIAGTMLMFSGGAYAQKAVGASNAMTCDVYGGRDIQVEAEAQAKAAADSECGVFGFGKAIKTGIRVISEYRGSCWAGNNSGVAVELSYTCK